MIRLENQPHIFSKNKLLPQSDIAGRDKTMAWSIINSHNTSGNDNNLKIKFDCMASHDITYVGIIQTARASGLIEFPIPYVLTNCHNSLCAVGGTINEDDHLFGLSAAQKYGGEFVPAHMAVIHQYMRERYAATGKMILASDSHTRYGPFGAISIGEGGPELVKQLLGRTYDISRPDVIACWLENTPKHGVGPQDIALAIIGATFSNGFVKNKIIEFIGPGISSLSMDFRNGIDVMTTETTCLSTVWQTDDTVRQTLASYRRENDYKQQLPTDGACYDGAIFVDLSKVEPMIAIPFHPSNTYTISEFNNNAADILRKIERDAQKQWELDKAPNLTGLLENGRFKVQQGMIAGCSGGLAQNIRAARNIINSVGNDIFSLAVYPASQPMMMALTKDGTIADLMSAGAIIRTAFCGPCFGAGDVPACGGFSVRHTTRNFPNREGSKPNQGQTAYVALMDARSIAATATNGGYLTSASDVDYVEPNGAPEEFFDAPYKSRVYCGVNKSMQETELRFGPNITDWPVMTALPEDLTLTFATVITDQVTTTDELIPSGDASSYRSNPMRLAEFTLSRKDPKYVERCKQLGYGSAVCAFRPGDGSAREQAASCQRVLGGIANVAIEYATKRYRSNLINWGMLPFVWEELESNVPSIGDTIVIKNLRSQLADGKQEFQAVWTNNTQQKNIVLHLPNLTNDERDIILAGCLINYYAAQ